MAEPVDAAPSLVKVEQVEALHERIRTIEGALALDCRDKVVVLRIPEAYCDPREVGDLATRLREAGATLVLVLPDDPAVTIDVVDDEQMARAGWSRTEPQA